MIVRIKAFVLRHQKAGVLTDKVYLVPPTDEEQAAAKVRLDRLHSTDGWLRAVPTVLEIPDSFADLADRFELADEEPEPQGRDGASGVAQVTGPRVSIVAHAENP